jgi:hypothetical protein
MALASPLRGFHPDRFRVASGPLQGGRTSFAAHCATPRTASSDQMWSSLAGRSSLSLSTRTISNMPSRLDVPLDTGAPGAQERRRGSARRTPTGTGVVPPVPIGVAQPYTQWPFKKCVGGLHTGVKCGGRGGRVTGGGGNGVTCTGGGGGSGTTCGGSGGGGGGSGGAQCGAGALMITTGPGSTTGAGATGGSPASGGGGGPASGGGGGPGSTGGVPPSGTGTLTMAGDPLSGAGPSADGAARGAGFTAGGTPIAADGRPALRSGATIPGAEAGPTTAPGTTVVVCEPVSSKTTPSAAPAPSAPTSAMISGALPRDQNELGAATGCRECRRRLKDNPVSTSEF